MAMLTSLGSRGDARHFEELGFAAYAIKPIRPQELMGMLPLVLTEMPELKGTMVGAVTPPPVVPPPPAA